MLTHVDLFSGIGGFALAARWAGYETIQFCEIEPFCRKVLQKNFPGVPIDKDITAFDAQPFRGRVSLLTAGVPCQDVSLAGKRQGLYNEDGTVTRTGLWFEALRVIRECTPSRVIIENVPGLRTNGSDTVLEGLEEAGYTCWALVVGADDVGAPHRRKRVWIVGIMDDAGHMQGRRLDGTNERDNTPAGRQLHHAASGDAIEDVGDAEASRYAASLPERITETVSCVTCSSGTVQDSSCEQDRLLCESELHRDAGRTVAKMGASNSTGRREQCGSEPIREKQLAAECRCQDVDEGGRGTNTVQQQMDCRGRNRVPGPHIRREWPPGPNDDWRGVPEYLWPTCESTGIKPPVRDRFDGVSGIVVRQRQIGTRSAILRGLGNAVIPEVAYAVIMAVKQLQV